MTCDKGCMPDWRVHSMHVSHLSRRDAIKPRGLQHWLQLRLRKELLGQVCKIVAELVTFSLFHNNYA